jgi:hypothetical protein
MTISVVTVRDENGAPSTRELFRDGASYKIVSGNLEIISSARKALGLYPSGNWLSVYVGDCVRVKPAGAESEPGGGFATTLAAGVAAAVGASVSQAAAATEAGPQVTEPTPGEDVAPDAVILVGPEPDLHRPPDVAGFGSTPETTRRSGLRPVVFRMRAPKPKPPDPDPPSHNGRMRVVAFHAKASKPKPPDPDPPSGNGRMRPVIIRPRTYARERDDPPTHSPDK